MKIERIPKKWDTVRLEEVTLDLIGGGTPSTSQPNYWNGDIPWMTSANLTDRIVLRGMRNITKQGLQNSATNIVPKSSLLISTRVGIGKVGIAGIDIAISQDLTGLVLDIKRADVEYLYWAFLNQSSHLGLLSQGSTVKGLTREYLKNLRIFLPPLPEQKKIAEILSTVDQAIQRVGEAIETTQKLKKGLMQELLTKGIGNKEFKDTEIGRIPENWKIVKILEIGKITTGKTPSTSNRAYWNGDIPFITPADIKEGKYIYQTERCVTSQGAQQIGFILPANAVLVVCIGSTIGKTGLTYKESVTNQQINSIVCNNDTSKHYVYYATTFRADILRSFSGVAAVPIIKKSLFEQVKLPLPPLPEQQKIAEILSAVDGRLELLRKRKERLERIKKGLMEDLLTGKRRVKL